MALLYLLTKLDMKDIPLHRNWLGHTVLFYRNEPSEPVIRANEEAKGNVFRGEVVDQRIADPVSGIPTFEIVVKSPRTGNTLPLNSTLNYVRSV